MKFFSFVLRALGKRLEVLMIPFLVFPIFPAFFRNTLGVEGFAAGYATEGLLFYSGILLVLVVAGVAIGWFDQRPFRLWGLVVLIAASVIAPLLAIDWMYLSGSKETYMIWRWKPTYILYAVGLALLVVDRQDKRWKRRKFVHDLDED